MEKKGRKAHEMVVDHFITGVFPIIETVILPQAIGIEQDQIASRIALGLPRADPGFLTELRIARILGETGALTDYHSLEGLMKYAGLNLRERRSGQFVGQVRLSKKGRAPLRRVLGEAAFRLVKKTELYGPYYHAKKEKGMPGTKILAAVERKLLGVFYTLGIKAVAFDPHRFATCESNFRKAA